MLDALSRHYHRREALRIGGLSALGLSLPQLLQGRAEAGEAHSFGRAKSVIMFWLLGGVPQHESWDPKPDAPAEVRGEFGVIPTATPGLHVGELMPLTAKLTDRIAVLRSVVTHDNAHSSSGYQMLTGEEHIPLSQENVTSKAPNLAPTLASVVRALRPDRGGLPASIALPHHIANDGEIVWPGQDAGFMGRKYDPWLLSCDPNDPNFSIPALTLPAEVSAQRFGSRRSLLTQLDDLTATINQRREVQQFNRHSEEAIDLLAGGAARRAFAIEEEPAAVRDRYGRYRFGQSVLLARRLVEAGVSLVQVNWQRIDGKPNNGTWDVHNSCGKSCKDFLMPLMDQTWSALLEDLKERGLLDETLVVWISEFGHTPKHNGNAGRDHWGHCFSCALAGGGIQGGLVHGKSDPHAAYPVTGMVAPRDITATILHCLGYHPETVMHDPGGRPLPITRGKVIEDILG